MATSSNSLFHRTSLGVICWCALFALFAGNEGLGNSHTITATNAPPGAVKVKALALINPTGSGWTIHYQTTPVILTNGQSITYSSAGLSSHVGAGVTVYYASPETPDHVFTISSTAQHSNGLGGWTVLKTVYSKSNAINIPTWISLVFPYVDWYVAALINVSNADLDSAPVTYSWVPMAGNEPQYNGNQNLLGVVAAGNSRTFEIPPELQPTNITSHILEVYMPSGATATSIRYRIDGTSTHQINVTYDGQSLAANTNAITPPSQNITTNTVSTNGVTSTTITTNNPPSTGGVSGKSNPQDIDIIAGAGTSAGASAINAALDPSDFGITDGTFSGTGITNGNFEGNSIYTNTHATIDTNRSATAESNLKESMLQDTNALFSINFTQHSKVFTIPINLPGGTIGLGDKSETIQPFESEITMNFNDGALGLASTAFRIFFNVLAIIFVSRHLWSFIATRIAS